MDALNVRKIRQDLYGQDKLDKDAEGVYEDFTCFDRRGSIVGRFRITVRRQHSTRRNPSGHRIFVDCPCCGATVPAGRIAQHYRTAKCLAQRTPTGASV